MAVKRMRVTAIPRSRFQSSLLYDIQEWRETVKEIKKGLTAEETLQIRLSPTSVSILPMKNPLRAFYITLKRHVQQHKYPVEVLMRASDEGPGVFDIWVVGK